MLKIQASNELKMDGNGGNYESSFTIYLFCIMPGICNANSVLSFFSATAASSAKTMTDTGLAEDPLLPSIPFPQPQPGTIDRMSTIMDKGHAALHYIGRPEVVESLNNVSAATNNLTAHGIKHQHQLQPSNIIPQIGFGITGVIATVCGIGIITHTALQKKAEDAKRKYLIGTAMTAFGFFSLAMSGWLNNR